MTGRQLTIGVLGHVDHGKTTLVKALTGTDTDRLEEEKRRGLSIVLGFAFLESDKGIIDFVDAPGHEDFIRTMISGATGIDAILLVVAADEGIKPQTREHFAIAQLLGVKQGLVVINKTDLVDASALTRTREEIREAMRGTFLEDAPMHCVSAATGAGANQLRKALTGMIADTATRPNTESFFLPMDRVFTIDGVGTIGTGTLRSGAIRCEDEVEIMPSGIKAGVREIQVHSHPVTEAHPGQRVAVNLRGIKRDQLERGQVLIRPGSVQETTCLHARMHVLDDLPRLPKRNELVRLLFGTNEVLAKVRVVGGSRLETGSDFLVQLRCRDNVVVNTGEYFIARTSSPATTFGGGKILDTSDELLQLPRDVLIEHLNRLEEADVAARIGAHIRVAGKRGIALPDLAERATASRSQIDAALKTINAVVIDDVIAVDGVAFADLVDETLLALEKFHKENPAAAGQDLEQLRAALLESCPTEIVAYVTRQLSDANKIEIMGPTVRLAAFDRDDNIDPSERAAIDSIEQAFRDGGATTPAFDEVVGNDPSRQRAYEYLKDSGRLVALRDHGGAKLLVFHQDTIDSIKQQLSETYPPPKNFTVSDFRILTGSTRKYVIPMLEYFDRNRITIRRGDYRALSRAAYTARE